MSDQEFADLAAGGPPPSRMPASLRKHWNPDGTPKLGSHITGTIVELREENEQLRRALRDVLDCFRTFRNVPNEDKNWTSLDDAAFEQGEAALQRDYRTEGGAK